MGAAVLIGRGHALAALDDAVTAARAGSGSLVLVAGEAGIGKTALAAEVLRRASGGGLLALWASCTPGLSVPAYWPWVQVLRGVMRAEPGTLPVALRGLVEDPPPEAHPMPALPGTEPEAARFRMFDALAGYLTDAGRRHPLVAIVDDLHWADEPSLRALRFVAERLPAAPVLMVGTYRDVEAQATLRDIARTAALLPLGGLDEAGVGELMARLLAAAGASAPAAEVTHEVWRRTRGNPFLARELTRLLTHDHVLPDAVPAQVRDVLAGRLARLSPNCADVLGYAALLGDPFETDVLALVCRRPLTDVVDLLEEAAAQRVLLRLPAPTGTYRFVHDLFRETVAADLADRRERHHTLGRALVALADQGRAIPPARLADQFCSAGPQAADDAVRWALRAADAAGARLAHEDACAHLERACAASPHLEPATRADLFIRLGEARHTAGRAEEAREAFREGAGLARRTGEPVALARCALGMHRLGARVARPDAAAAALLREAARLLPDEARSWRALVLAAMARERHNHRLRPDDEADDLAARAVALARADGDPGLVAMCLLAAHDVAWRPGTATVRLPLVEQMLELADQAGYGELRTQAMQLRAALLLELGDPRALSALAEYCRTVEALGHPRARWNATTRRATLATLAGRLDEAADLVAEGLALGERIGEPDSPGLAGSQTVVLSRLAEAAGWDTGRLAPLARTLGPDVDVFGRIGDPLALALGLLASRDVEGAARTMAGYPVGDIPGSHDAEPLVFAAWIFSAVGSDEQRRHAYAALEPFAGTGSVVGGAAAFQGPVDLALGELAESLGWLDAAVEHYRAAVRFARKLGVPLWERAAESRLGGVNLFRREGQVWRLRYAGREVLAPDSKGMRDLAVLLAAPGREVAANELLGRAVTAGADPVLDDRARAEYRTRLTELESEHEQAEVAHDLARAERARAEYDFLLAELSAATGLGGRRRLLADETERGRKTVTARIRYAVRRIGTLHPQLGAHLDSAVRTGSQCSYRPHDPLTWRT